MIEKEFEMMNVIKKLWKYDRHMISNGYDQALFELSKIMYLKITEIQSGEYCSTWKVPNKWMCHQAFIETLDGKKVLDIKNGNLYCIAYSQSFEGIISQEELFKHLFSKHAIETNDMIDGAPFLWTFYYRKGWGLSCSKKNMDNLVETKYRVVINTEFASGSLKIAEATLQGESDETFLICAHLCHAQMVQDGLSGVVVGMDALKKLSKLKNRYYTYKLIIAPETIGGICWIDKNSEIIPKIRGGVYLDMLGLPYPHALQLSYWRESEVDRCFRIALKEKDPHGWSDKFRQIVGNDERQYGGPGVRIPMVGLSRSLPKTDKYFPYREYHSSLDTPDIVKIRSLEESRDLLIAAINLLEKNYYPINCFKGEIFLSGLGFDIDYYRNKIQHAEVMDIMHLIDGEHSILDIIETTNYESDTVINLVEQFRQKKVVTLSKEPKNTSLWKPCLRDIPDYKRM